MTFGVKAMNEPAAWGLKMGALELDPQLFNSTNRISNPVQVTYESMTYVLIMVAIKRLSSSCRIVGLTKPSKYQSDGRIKFT